MKYLKRLSLCLIASIFFNTAISQQPYQLTDTSNKWYEYGQFGGFGFYPRQNVHLWYYFNGDTLINGVPYKQLFHDYRDTTYSTPIYSQHFVGYSAAFRQDSLKVYFIMKDSTSEKLYCDFDMAVGDTLKYIYNDVHNVISSVTSIAFGTTTRTRYVLDNGFSFYDGVGNALGLFHNYAIGIEGGVYLVCFEQAGITQNVYDLWGTPPACGLTGNGVLPVQLIGFSCNKQLDACILNWESANEFNLSQYIVQYSKDGYSFQDVAVIQAKGPDSYYTFKHQNVNGRAFFRLKMVDNDGMYKYSEVKVVGIESKTGFTIVPNPANDHILILSGSSNNLGVVQILSMDGVVIKTIKNYVAGREISIADFSKGIYIVKMISLKDEVLLKKLFIKI